MKLPVEYVIEKYQDRLYGAAYSMLQNSADAKDAVQMAYIKYVLDSTDFADEEHIRSWLFRSTLNQAKDIQRAFWRRNKRDLQDYENFSFERQEDKNLFETVSKMPAKYRIVLQLFYYEDYSVEEISKIAQISTSNVKKRLSRARAMLKERLLEEWNDENE